MVRQRETDPHHRSLSVSLASYFDLAVMEVEDPWIQSYFSVRTMVGESMHS